MEKIWADAFGEDYPAGLEHYGYLTRQDLASLSALLDLQPGSSLLDIGCGKGGPGLRLAETGNLQLTGVDIIPAALDQAREFQQAFQLKYPATFAEGGFLTLPLPDESMDAVLSIDSLWTVPNKIEGLAAVKRVMKPGARFIFTHWDLLAVDPVELLEQSGLKFISRQDTPNWKTYQEKVYAGIHQYQEELVAEMGEAANMLLYEAQASPPYLDLSVRRIYVFEK